jgi:hypothetical protein
MTLKKFYAKFYGGQLKKTFLTKLTFQNKMKKFIGYRFHQSRSIFTGLKLKLFKNIYF